CAREAGYVYTMDYW
nr:immunoglobulin heavy chain junction region [Mus musculus]